MHSAQQICSKNKPEMRKKAEKRRTKTNKNQKKTSKSKQNPGGTAQVVPLFPYKTDGPEPKIPEKPEHSGIESQKSTNKSKPK